MENRVIRFRAWLPKINKMECGLFGLRSDGMVSFNDEGAILMQFTGLKAKDKKEIYESDIVRFYGGTTGIIKFINGSWKIEYTIMPYRAVAKIVGFASLSKHSEIIGNIYEHSHLLNS